MDCFKKTVQLNLATILILWLCLSNAHAGNVVVISEAAIKHQATFLSLLQQDPQLSKNHTLTSLFLQELSKERLLSLQPSVIVSLSSNISKKLLSYQLNTPTFHTLTALSSLSKLVPCLPDCSQTLPGNQFLILDQPVSRQLKLISQLSPARNKLAFLYTSKSALSAKVLLEENSYFDIATFAITPATLGFRFNEISKNADVILAVADTDLFNNTTLAEILLTSYRNKTPVIGFSRGFVKAGALTAIISELPQLAKQLVELLTVTPTVQKRPNSSLIYPKYFEVITNRNVSKSLFLELPEDNELTEILQSYEAF